jgi:large subunit ribosomal protein L4
VRRLALKSALSEKLAENNLNVLDQIVIEAPKTKDFIAITNALQTPKKTLFIVGNEENTENAYLSSRNLPEVTMSNAKGINVYDLVNANKLVLTAAAVKDIEEALA